MKKKLLLAFSLMGAAMLSQAQTKIGGALGAADKNSYLQLGDTNGANKGLLLPRVELTFTTSATPLTAFVDGMYVYNTANQNDVTPGLYYSENNHWVKVTTGTAVALNITGNGKPCDATGKDITNQNPVKGMIYTDVDGGDPDAIPAVPASPTYGQQWTYDGTKWISYSAPSATEWYLAGGTNDAAGNKTSNISRKGPIEINAGGPDYRLKPGTVDHAYMEWYARTATPNTRSGWIGYGNTGSKDFAVTNQLAGGRFIVSTVGKSNAMTVDAAGLVGIGTTTPQSLLDVNGDALINGHTIGRGGGNNSMNVAFGSQVLSSTTNTGAANTGIGASALQNNHAGDYNTAVGYQTLQANTDGYTNCAFGARALTVNSTGIYNAAFGAYSLLAATTGSNNVAVGHNAGLKLMDGSYNVILGDNAGSSQTTGNNNIIIGNNVQVPNNAGSNQMNIGNIIYGTGVNGAVGAGNVGIGTTSPTAKLEVNNGTTNGAIKIVDGTQGVGKILTSDANGVATWQAPSGAATSYFGSWDNSKANISIVAPNAAPIYTGLNITLPPGKYFLSVLLGYQTAANSNFWRYASYGFSATPSSPQQTRFVGGQNYPTGNSYSSGIVSTQWVIDLTGKSGNTTVYFYQSDNNTGATSAPYSDQYAATAIKL